MNSLYDVYLGAYNDLQGYRCRALSRSSAPEVVSRFATGQPGQSDLDLLKSSSVDNISGGMFQRDHKERNRVARARGLFSPWDEYLYPTPPRTVYANPSGSWSNPVVAKSEGIDISFIGSSAYSTGTNYNSVRKFTFSGGLSVTTLTLPLAIRESTGQLSGMCQHKGYLYLAFQGVLGTIASYRYNISADTYQDISTVVMHFFTIRDKLYAIKQDGGIYAVTNETAAGSATYTLITTAGGATWSIYQPIEFNGAAWISKSDGLYRFDGTAAVKVLDVHATLTPFLGWMYYFQDRWLYRFNGSVVQKVQYFDNESVNMLTTTRNYLMIQTLISVTSAYNEKGMTDSTDICRIYAYDGEIFTIANEAQQVFSGTGSQTPGRYILGMRSYITQRFFDGTTEYNWTSEISPPLTATASNSTLDVTTSEDDGGFPNVYKSLEAIDVSYYGMINGDVITVTYSLFDGKSWSAWHTLGTITYSSATNYLEITDSTKKLYKRVKINAEVTTFAASSTLKLKGVGWRYTLQPRTRWSWDLTLQAVGNDKNTDLNGTPISSDSNALTNAITKSIKSKTPLYMLSPDYAKVYAQINAAAVSVVIKGQIPIYTDPYAEYPLVAIKNNSGTWEILRISAVSYDSGTDRTTLTIVERGYLGITAAQINADAEFHLCYRVYITAVSRETTILDTGVYNEQPTTGESQILREYLLKVTEV